MSDAPDYVVTFTLDGEVVGTTSLPASEWDASLTRPERDYLLVDLGVGAYLFVGDEVDVRHEGDTTVIATVDEDFVVTVTQPDDDKAEDR